MCIHRSLLSRIETPLTEWTTSSTPRPESRHPVACSWRLPHHLERGGDLVAPTRDTLIAPPHDRAFPLYDSRASERPATGAHSFQTKHDLARVEHGTCHLAELLTGCPPSPGKDVAPMHNRQGRTEGESLQPDRPFCSSSVCGRRVRYCLCYRGRSRSHRRSAAEAAWEPNTSTTGVASLG